MKSPPEPSETLSSASAGPSRPFFSITSPQLQEEFRKERLRRLEAHGDVNGTSSPPSPRTSPFSSSPSSQASPLRTSSQGVPPLSPSFPAASPLQPSSPQAVSPLRTSSPQASPLDSPFSPTPSDSPSTPLKSSPWQSDGSPALSLSSPELLSELKQGRPQPLRRVPEKKGLTTVFSGRGRQVSGSSPIA
ncbi:DNA-directed RNA polymerase II subunit rpb1 [Fundulus heteroclitus]|uniref:DNA-directed RNA polymerase II subunit rpb1 n=1 Tax=Fundulus heteroclitus TaxID=8078 RepID=UPI00165B16C2|nr:DNA-directed RNA polymerase II subunit rpb1 [Fundulus heteroclitus]